jgi:hypothetical protein
MEKNNPHVETTIEGYSSSELMNVRWRIRKSIKAKERPV